MRHTKISSLKQGVFSCKAHYFQLVLKYLEGINFKLANYIEVVENHEHYFICFCDLISHQHNGIRQPLNCSLEFNPKD